MTDVHERDCPWYALVESGSPLSQGDFLDGRPVLIPRVERVQEGEELVGIYSTYDVVVMSQSCDLLHEKVQLVLVCPVWDLTPFSERNPHYRSAKAREQLRRGEVPGCHLLNRCAVRQHERDFRVVDFRNVYGVPFDYLSAGTDEPRLRLLPPYREHLAQAFARFFMRMGLPVDIPPFQ